MAATKTYKEMSEMLEAKIQKAKSHYSQNEKLSSLSCLIDSWISIAERDTETPKEEKEKKAEELIACIERLLEETDPECEESYMIFGLTLTYLGLRQMINHLPEGEKEARIVRVEA